MDSWLNKQKKNQSQKKNQPTKQLRCFNLKSVKRKSFHILYSFIMCLIIRWVLLPIVCSSIFACHLVMIILSSFSHSLVIFVSFAIIFYLFSLLPGFSWIFISIHSLLMMFYFGLWKVHCKSTLLFSDYFLFTVNYLFLLYLSHKHLKFHH